MRLCVLLAIAVCAADAHADRADAYLDVVPPWIQATVIGKPAVAVGELSISAEDGTSVEASSIRTEPEPLALALVVSGKEIWIGDDDLGEEPSYAGALKSLVPAIDAAGVNRFGPAGSKVVIISYSSGTEVKLPMSDLAKLTGAALGGQRDYYGKIGDDLVQGITAGLDQLASTDAPRKALIVIGDGNDTNNDGAVAQFPELAARADAERVQIYALIYKTQLSDEGNAITKLIPDAKMVHSQTDFANSIGALSERIGDRYAVMFNAKAMPWDGMRHRFVIHASGSDILASAVLPVWERPDVWWKAPWRWVVVGVGLVALIALALLMRSRLRAASA